MLNATKQFTWTSFEIDICEGNKELVDKCKKYCSRLEVHIDMVEKNLDIIKENQSFIISVRKIHPSMNDWIGEKDLWEMNNLFSQIRSMFPDEEPNIESRPVPIFWK